MEGTARGTSLDTGNLDPIASLDDPTRRRLYEHVVAQGQPVTRDAASQALGIDRATVAYHLDRLVDEGLLSATFARPAGRAGPGAGRPAKRYERSREEFAVTVPPRDYRLAAELLARAAATDRSGTVRKTLRRTARQFGRELAGGQQAPHGRAEAAPGEAEATHAQADLLDHLAQQGFEPYEEDGVVRLRNCPFHRLAQEHTELICGMNEALLAGTVEALGAPYTARLDPADGRCCVVFRPK